MADDKRPKVNSEGAKELEKAKEQIDTFQKSVEEMTMDRMNMAPKQETEPQTKLSTTQLRATPDHYLKPKRSVASREKFNEKFRAQYEYAKVYVPFIAEHSELKGESIEIWTKKYPGMPAEEWIVPTNTPVWGPRYLAEQIKSKFYHRLSMSETASPENYVGSAGPGAMYGKMIVDNIVQRLDARPVNTQRKSVFMGADGT